LLSVDTPDLDLQIDPKCSWAVRNFDIFPVEINRADYETLLRVPGIGVLSARKILAARRSKSLNYEDARKLGVVLKRAVFFLTFNGKYETSYSFSNDELRNSLADKRGKLIISPSQMRLEDLAFVQSY
jgi:predicted DNA-binding helix-hairpin-helix protein